MSILTTIRAARFVTIFSLGFALAGCTRTNATSAQPNGAAAPPTAAASAQSYQVLPSPALARAGQNGNASIADIVERVLPSVVSVWSTRVAHGGPSFFGLESPRDFKQQGLGSGVVIGPGMIVTNNHVVSGADDVKVTTPDKHELVAEVVGTDAKSDLALLRVKGDTASLKPIELGDSSRLRLGDVVLAIGNPFGVGQTVTMGIVSAKGRANMGITDYEDFIQTDAAINPGNSGGALVDMEGHLVGINTAILSRTGGNVGIGFAIPSNMTKPIIDSLAKNGKVVRGFLGVSIQDVDQEVASAMKLPLVSGVLVSNVQAGTPAERAGLQRGDVVLKLDGKSVDGVGQFRNAIAVAGADGKIKLDLLRDGKERVLDVALAEQPSELSKRAQTAPSSNPGVSGSLDGLTLQELSPERRRRFQIPSDVKAGVVVTDVERGSPAAETGLRPGDVILEVNRTKVDSVARFKSLFQGRALLLVYRDGETRFIVARH